MINSFIQKFLDDHQGQTLPHEDFRKILLAEVSVKDRRTLPPKANHKRVFVNSYEVTVISGRGREQRMLPLYTIARKNESKLSVEINQLKWLYENNFDAFSHYMYSRIRTWKRTNETKVSEPKFNRDVEVFMETLPTIKKGKAQAYKIDAELNELALNEVKIENDYETNLKKLQVETGAKTYLRKQRDWKNRAGAKMEALRSKGYLIRGNSYLGGYVVPTSNNEICEEINNALKKQLKNLEKQHGVIHTHYKNKADILEKEKNEALTKNRAQMNQLATDLKTLDEEYAKIRTWSEFEVMTKYQKIIDNKLVMSF